MYLRIPVRRQDWPSQMNNSSNKQRRHKSIEDRINKKIKSWQLRELKNGQGYLSYIRETWQDTNGKISDDAPHPWMLWKLSREEELGWQKSDAPETVEGRIVQEKKQTRGLRPKRPVPCALATHWGWPGTQEVLWDMSRVRCLLVFLKNDTDNAV